MSLGHLLSAAIEESHDFVDSPSQSTLPPLNQRIPHLLFAAPVAGGWGIPDSLCVHSAGFVGWPAGGIVEVVARSDRSFAAELVPSGGAPQSVAMERPPSSHPQILKSVWSIKPSQDPEWRWI
jgi:hypothetical protein